MNAFALRRAENADFAPKAKPKKRAHALALPSMQTVAARLASLTPASMPWLRKDVDLTPPDGGPEVFGAAVYVPVGAGKRPANKAFTKPVPNVLAKAAVQMSAKPVAKMSAKLRPKRRLPPKK